MARIAEQEVDTGDATVNALALGVSLRPVGPASDPLGSDLGTPTKFMPRIPARALNGIIALAQALDGDPLARALRRVAAEAGAAGDHNGKAVRAAALLLCDLVRLG